MLLRPGLRLRPLLQLQSRDRELRLRTGMQLQKFMQLHRRAKLLDVVSLRRVTINIGASATFAPRS